MKNFVKTPNQCLLCKQIIKDDQIPPSSEAWISLFQPYSYCHGENVLVRNWVLLLVGLCYLPRKLQLILASKLPAKVTVFSVILMAQTEPISGSSNMTNWPLKSTSLFAMEHTLRLKIPVAEAFVCHFLLELMLFFFS